MKIKESKYYKPIKILSLDENNAIEVIDKSETYPRETYYQMLKNSLYSIDIDRESGVVISRDKLKDFVQCTDLYCVSHSAKNNKLYEDASCYFHSKLEIFVILSANISNNYHEESFEEGVYFVEYIFYDASHQDAKNNVNTFFENYCEKYVSKEAKISILMYQNNQFSLKTHIIKPYRIDLDTMYNDDFKPVHQEIKQSISEKNKGVVLLHGVAGAGKTNYIKWLTSQIPNKKFIFVPTTMIGSLTDPSFIGLLVDNPNSVLVMEDCENYIAERNTMNSNTDVVSTILNIADGILSDVLECQLICTFNSDISKIDTALLRDGRLIAEYKFKELSAEKCNEYLQSVGKETNIENPISLATLMNLEHQALKEKGETRKIGF